MQSRGKCTRDSLQNVKAVSMSVRQRSREVQSDEASFLSVRQTLASKFVSPAPRLFFFYCLKDSFASAAMMKKHSMNPFILRICPAKSSCVRLTDRRAFTWSSCQQDLFCGEPVNFVDAKLVNNHSHPPKRTHSVWHESSRGPSADEPVGPWETAFLPWKGNNRGHFIMFFPEKGTIKVNVPHSIHWKGTREGTFVGFWPLKGTLMTNLFLCRCIHVS